MNSQASNTDFSHLQDVMGTLPMLKRYVVISLIFALDQTVSTQDLEDTLKDALRRLATAFPFLAGQVVVEGRDERHSGIPKIVPLEETIQLLVNDLRQTSDFPSMDEMRKAEYPFSMLNADILAPPIAMSWTADKLDTIAPVLVFQANFVKGGVVLTISGNHMTMDMTGLGMIIALFAKACRGEAYSDEEVEQGNQSRRNAIPLLGDDYQPGNELDDSFAEAPGEQTDGATLSPPRWAYFNFSGNALRRLKEEASCQSLVPYTSTDDAIGALCWQRISKARETRLGRLTRTNLCRVISVRKYFNLKGYLGHMVDCRYEAETNVFEHPLGDIAARLRKLLLEDEKIRHHTQAFATMLQRLLDKSKLVNGAKMNPHRDVILSSYANARCCELSFGAHLGVPEAARRPRLPAWPSLLYLMPKDKKGDIAVAFCVSEDELTRLRKDSVLASYANYVG